MRGRFASWSRSAVLLTVLTLGAAGVFSSGRDAAPSAPCAETHFDAVTLPKSVRLYIPGTHGEEPAPELQAAWTERGLTAFGQWFGGATAVRAEGAWRDGEVLVREPVVIVYSHTTEPTLRQRRAAVLHLARQMRDEMDQSTVAVELDGDLVLIGGRPFGEAKGSAAGR